MAERGWTDEEDPALAEGGPQDPGGDAILGAALERAASLVAERNAEALVKRLPGEFAALQTLLIEALDRELPERDRREFTRAVTRLAEVFGAVQAAAMESLVAQEHEAAMHPPRPAGSAVAFDAPTGPAAAPPASSPDSPDAWLESLCAESRRTGATFALAHFEVEGVERIAKGYGSEAAAQMVEAVVGVLEGQLSERERAFRTGTGQLLAVIPDAEAADAVDLATRVADIVERSQARRGPRVEVAVGLASCPLHATSPTPLREAAEVAAWDARAGGRGIAIAPVSVSGYS